MLRVGMVEILLHYSITGKGGKEGGGAKGELVGLEEGGSSNLGFSAPDKPEGEGRE